MERHLISTCVGLAALSVSVAAFADDHPYSEGPVVNISRIRTMDGRFDDYMKWIDTVWKKEQEAGKRMGMVVGYEVLAAEPRSPDEPDVILVVRYKNWAALDNSIEKGDAIAKEIEGSVAAANKGQADRGAMRRILGSETMQEMVLK